MTSSSVDWRNRFGSTWLTKVKDQGGCGSCYIYGSVGVFEAMLRIEHHVWCRRDEDDVKNAISLTFGAASACGGGGPDHVLTWITANGVTDQITAPSSKISLGHPTPDRLGRTSRLDKDGIVAVKKAHVTLSGVEQMKQWVDLTGPITACFNCYPDLDKSCKDDAVYTPPANGTAGSDGHCVMIVGYDDHKKAWLIRNSWGTGWGTGGYGWFAYGTAGKNDENALEHRVCYGIPGGATNPDPWSKRRLHNGNFYESGNGTYHRNFEVFAQGPGGAVRHYVQNGKTLEWSLHETLPEVTLAPDFKKKGNDCAAQPTVFGSTYFRNFEILYLTTANELRHRLFDQTSQTWIDHGPLKNAAVKPAAPIMSAGGVPGFIQAAPGAPGNFELVVKNSQGGLDNWWRDDANNNAKWALKATFGANVRLSGATLVQRWAKGGAPYADLPAGLDLVCVTGEKVMQRFWRDDPNKAGWVACETFGNNVDSPPVMIRSQFGATDETVPGNYELCVAVDGAIEHWWMNGNPEPTTSGSWTMSEIFQTDRKGRKVKQVLGMVESSYGFDLEVVAELDNGALQHFSRDGAGWHAREVFA